MISVTSRGSDKPVCHRAAKVRYGSPRSITVISTFCYVCGQLCFDQGVSTNTFFRSVKVSYGRNVDTKQFKALLCLLNTNKSFEIIITALLNNRLQS